MLKSKKVFALLSALALFFAAGAGSAAFAADVWDGTVGTVPAAADGVITITTGSQLAAFASAVNSGTDYSGVTVRLGDDINLNNQDWTPIGYFFSYYDTNRAFRGTFDGAGHTISGLRVENTGDNSEQRGETAALFGYIDYVDASSSSSAVAAVMSVGDTIPAERAAEDAASLGLTGEAYNRMVAERAALYESFGVPQGGVSTLSVTSSSVSGGTVKNLNVYGYVKNIGGQGAAGIVCWNDGIIENCYFEGTVIVQDNGNRAYVGGICSLLGDDNLSHSTYVINCAAKVNAAAYGGSYSYAGGIAGYCYAMGRGYIVNCAVEEDSAIDSYMDTGGVVGGFAYKVYNCSSAAFSVTVDGRIENESGYFAGGIIGAYGAATSCNWLQEDGNTVQPGVSVGSGSDTDGLCTSIGYIPVSSVLLSPLSVAVGGRDYADVNYYPVRAGAETPFFSDWSSDNSSVASVSSLGAITGISAGHATISATASSSAWTSVSGVTVTPEAGVDVTQ